MECKEDKKAQGRKTRNLEEEKGHQRTLQKGAGEEEKGKDKKPDNKRGTKKKYEAA